MTRRFLLLAALAVPLAAQSSAPPARIVFSKSFPGSSPAYYEIQLDQPGAAVYKEAPDDDDPLKFQLSPSDAGQIFALAQKLDLFRRPLESKLKVANMGMKTLRYESGDTRNEVKFNFSEDLDARALAEWFERMAETAQHRTALERAARFDRLGVNKALLQLEVAMDRKRIVAPEQLLPVLDKIATQQYQVHIAQARAASIAERIRGARSQN